MSDLVGNPKIGFLATWLIYFWMCLVVGHDAFMYDITKTGPCDMQIFPKL